MSPPEAVTLARVAARRHLLDVDDLAHHELTGILARADDYAALLESGRRPPPELAGVRVALLFAEPSTRTRLSFEIAARNLGAEPSILDPGGSSLVKGESLPDTARTLAALGFDALVLRHHRSGAAAVAARHFAGTVINAGDGWHAHPTQALLDLLTLRQAFASDDLHGRKIAIVGDVRHSRVARSNVWTLTIAGAEVWACGPRDLLAGFAEAFRDTPTERRLTVTDDLDAALAGADAVMGLRIQFERMRQGALARAEYVARYQITEERLAVARPDACFMHPGPVNEGIEVTRAVARGPRSLILRQVRNGVPLRMAVLALTAGTQATRERSNGSR